MGGFDEEFFLYEEDADLCRRVRAAGWQVLFTPAAEVRHGLGKSMSRTPQTARLEYQRSHLLYYRKHNGAFDRVVLRLLLGGRALVDLAGAGIRGRAGDARSARQLLSLALGRG